MKKLDEYKEEIHKCSKCGLCQSVCPIYEITGNDCSVSRGKFIMLNGIIKGDLKLNKNINKYLDMCLKCNACKNFCPSGIDARKIFLTAKAEYFKKCPSSFFSSFFQSKLIFNSFLNLIKMASNTYRFFYFDKLISKFYPILFKMGWLSKKIILANEFLKITTETKKNKQAKTDNSGLKVVYFKGCVNNYINPKVKNAVENILNKMNVKVISTNFACCGIPFLSNGNAEQFTRQALLNLSQIPDDFDYFLTDCASCQDAFIEYKNYVDAPELLEKLQKINEKSINIVDFILKQVKNVEFKEKTSFTFHKPCHLEDLSFLPEFLQKSKNLEYIEMKEFDKCCGFSGTFAIKNPELSEKVSAKKAKKAEATNANYIVTACPSCILGLTQGMIENKKILPVISLIELLSLANLDLNSNYQNEDCNKNLFDSFVKKCF